MTADCNSIFWGDDKTFIESFLSKLQSTRVPISGTIEITHRCNLNCVHCYIKRQNQPDEDSVDELDTEEWRNLIDEMTASECLYLLITGGEPLLRSDFKDIYQYARESGLLVTVFTNGTLVNEEIVDLFSDLPPTMVEISLYGATEKVFESITGVTGSFEKCMAGIRRLISGGIETRIKTVLMTLNKDEFGQIEEIANELGSGNFRLDPLIMPGLDGSRTPLELRVSADEAVKLEFSNSRRIHNWIEFFRTRTPQLNADDRLYPCGAGLTSFSIDPCGILKPCLTAAKNKKWCHNIRHKGEFLKGWRDVIPGLRIERISPDSQCNSCEAKPFCGYCPPFFELETGKEDQPPEYLCKIGRLRLKTVKDLSGEKVKSAKRNLFRP